MNGLLLLAVTAAAFLAGGFLACWIYSELRSASRLKLIEILTSHSPAPGRLCAKPVITPSVGHHRIDQAIALLTSGCPCSETILRAYGPSLGLSRGEAFEIAVSLARKVNMCEACGAVTGAYIILGKRQPAEMPDRGESEQRLVNSLQEFTNRFKARHGTVTCRKLLIESARKRKPHNLRDGTIIPGLCPRLVNDAGQLLEQMLNKGHPGAVAS
jgi:C_GCAxxG_C_C family probable redox protein